MRKYRFIIELENGNTYGVYASNWRDAEILLKAFCILNGLACDIDITTGEEPNLAPRSLVANGKERFEQEWEKSTRFSLMVNQ